MLDPDDALAAARFRDAVTAESVDEEEAAAPERHGTTTYDLARFRARRIRERLLALLDTLAIAIERRDLGSVWRVLDAGDACRCFPPGLREEALMIAALPIDSFRAPMRLYRYQHLLMQLTDEPLEVACDPAQLDLGLVAIQAVRPTSARQLSFPGASLPGDGPDTGGSHRRSGSR